MAAQQEWVSIGQRVREARLAANLSQDELGRRLGLDRTMVAKIEAGTRRIDAVELIGLGQALDLPIDYFLRERPAVLSRRSGLLDEDATDASRGSFRLEAALVSWLHDVRQVQSFGVLTVGAILGYPEAADSEAAAQSAAGWLRGRLGSGNEPIESLVKACQEAGLLVAVADLPGDGASVRDDDLAVAVVSRRGDPGRRRSTAAHELGHLVLGDEYSSDLGVHTSRAARESVIDAFAAEFLLPSTVITAGGFSRDVLVRLASTYRTSWSLAVRQAVRAGVLDQGEAAGWLPLTPTRSELLDTTGWTPQPDLEWIRVPPAYAHAVLEARRRHLITTTRAVELMRGQIAETDLPPLDEDVAP
ncbi:helix-turn-helix domain-containing protein [Actinoplanes sp. HUAS TT8]|uniref:helix-turn-helix domain-containing protein n=1 Tax=Actinoplanes sp. HUAS TT8 TaxID=3447453 RepID=UPI003F52874D